MVHGSPVLRKKWRSSKNAATEPGGRRWNFGFRVKYVKAEEKKKTPFPDISCTGRLVFTLLLWLTGTRPACRAVGWLGVCVVRCHRLFKILTWANGGYSPPPRGSHWRVPHSMCCSRCAKQGGDSSSNETQNCLMTQ